MAAHLWLPSGTIPYGFAAVNQDPCEQSSSKKSQTGFVTEILVLLALKGVALHWSTLWSQADQTDQCCCIQQDQWPHTNVFRIKSWWYEGTLLLHHHHNFWAPSIFWKLQLINTQLLMSKLNTSPEKVKAFLSSNAFEGANSEHCYLMAICAW